MPPKLGLAINVEPAQSQSINMVKAFTLLVCVGTASALAHAAVCDIDFI